MPYNLDQLLEEFSGPSKADVWLKDDNGGQVIEGVHQAVGAPPPARYAAEPSPPSLEPIARPAREPLQTRAQPPAAQAAAPQQDGGFDWARAMAAASGAGTSGIDAMRAQRAQQKLAQEQDTRKAQFDAFSLDEQKRRAELLRSASDPQSETSAKMRDELLTGFSVIGDSMPNLKPMLDKFAGSMQNMSATDMLAMQQRMGGVFNIARQAGHDRATEATAASDRSLKERQIEATIQDRAEDNKRANADMGFKYASLAESREQRKDVQEAKAAERAQLADEKAVSSYQKEAIPLDQNTKTLTDVKESKVKTGWIPDKFQKARQFFGFKDDDWDSAEGALASVSNEIRHGLFGASLTPGERAEFIKMLPGMDVPRATFDAKLKVVLDRMAEKKRMIDAGHPRAVKALGGAKSETPTLPKASSLKGDPAARIEEILKANPNHPRADELKAKLAELRGE